MNNKNILLIKLKMKRIREISYNLFVEVMKNGCVCFVSWATGKQIYKLRFIQFEISFRTLDFKNDAIFRFFIMYA